LENTLLIFLADNGGCAEEPGGRDTNRIPGPKEYYTAVGPAWGWVQNTPFKRYKQWVNEGGISTPMILHWPAKIPAGTRSSAVGHVIDLAPTCADLAGADWPKRYDGRDVHPSEGLSMRPVIEGESADRHEKLFWEWSGNRAVRQGKHKLVYDKLENEWALYDIAVDRTETNDLAEEHPQLASKLEAEWNEWAKETGVWKAKK
jgi:arylsulfatase A-like enzyme